MGRRPSLTEGIGGRLLERTADLAALVVGEPGPRHLRITAVTGKWSDGARPSRPLRSIPADTTFQSRDTPTQSIRFPFLAAVLNGVVVPSSGSRFGCATR